MDETSVFITDKTSTDMKHLYIINIRNKSSAQPRNLSQDRVQRGLMPCPPPFCGILNIEKSIPLVTGRKEWKSFLDRTSCNMRRIGNWINPMKRIYTTESVSETENLGAEIGRAAKPGDVIALFGELGTGKTAITRGIACGLGITEDITSGKILSFISRKESASPAPGSYKVFADTQKQLIQKSFE